MEMTWRDLNGRHVDAGADGRKITDRAIEAERAVIVDHLAGKHGALAVFSARLAGAGRILGGHACHLEMGLKDLLASDFEPDA